jgi:hypothetical protein
MDHQHQHQHQQHHSSRSLSTLFFVISILFLISIWRIFIEDNEDALIKISSSSSSSSSHHYYHQDDQSSFCSKPKIFLHQHLNRSTSSSTSSTTSNSHFSSRIITLPSYPGSGNTWVRHLIQESTRIFTGSAYFDPNITLTFPGEGIKDNTVIVIKTHYPCGGCWQIGIPNTYLNRPVKDYETGLVPHVTTIIYLIRSPFDTLLADFNRMRSGGNHTGYLSSEKLKEPKFLNIGQIILIVVL